MRRFSRKNAPASPSRQGRQIGQEESMSKKLSINSLPHHITGEHLKTLFSEAGSVTFAKVIHYVHNGEPCGFGFVEMDTKEAGQKAMLMLNGRNLDGHHLAVKEDNQRSKYFFGIRSRKGR
jgi:cold-inducible RNA-binding protein